MFVIDPYRFVSASNGLLNNLQGAYLLDSDATDEQANQDGTDSNVTWDTSDYVLGTACGSFNGSSSYITCDGLMTGAVKQNISVAAWIKIDDAPASREQIMFRGQSGGASSPYGESFSLECKTVSSTIRLSSWVYAKTDDIYTTTTITAGTRTHVGLSYSASTDTIKLFINGVEEYSKDAVGVSTTANHAEFSIGRSTDANNNRFYFDGRIDQALVWTDTLVEADFAALYNSGAGLPYSSFTS